MSPSDVKQDLEDTSFSDIPWCRAILDDLDFEIEPTLARKHHPQTGENNFLAHKLKTLDTIDAWCSTYRRPTPSRNMKDEVRTLLSLKEGLNGYPRVCHGGVLATLLDEISSVLVAECRSSRGLPPENVTADLRIGFIKPVMLPCVVLVKAKVCDIQKRRKYHVEANMMDPQGTVLATAKGLFICIGVEKL